MATGQSIAEASGVGAAPMAVKDEDRKRIELEVKKKLLLSVKGFPNCGFQYDYGCGSRHTCQGAGKKVTTLMDQLPVFCQYESKGCQEILMKEDMGSHENRCIFRPIHCPYLDCQTRQTKTTYFGLMDHLAQVHKNGIFKMDMKFNKKFKQTRSVLQNGQYQTTIQIDGPNKTFFEVGTNNGQFQFHWIYFHGDPDEAKNYFYHAKIKSGESKQEMTYSGQVRSLSETKQKIMNAFDAFYIPHAKVKKFQDENSKLVIEYKIRNMKEEAKDDDEESGIDDDE